MEMSDEVQGPADLTSE